MESMHHGDEEQTERQYAARISWDETMQKVLSITSRKSNIQGRISLVPFMFNKAWYKIFDPQEIRPNVVVITPQSVTEQSPSGTDYQLAVPT